MGVTDSRERRLISPVKTESADFNPAAWAELLSLFGRAGAAELVSVLVDDLPRQRSELAEAARAADPHGLKRLAHDLRGAAQQLGAQALAQLWTLAELAAAAGQRDEAIRLSQAALQRHALLVAHFQREAGDA
ncbi:MAG: Hpt domain-containing protein [Panacagrimonas sp.]